MKHSYLSFSLTLTITVMEEFKEIYLDSYKQPGLCRFIESGLGWKPSKDGNKGNTFTLEKTDMAAAQWSRGAKGYQLKILLRASGVVQLDGFEEEVSVPILNH